MKNAVKKFVAMMLAGVMSFSVMACGSSGSGAASTEGASASEKAGKNCTIGVAFYQDSGLATTAAKAYLDNMADTLNCEFKYTVLSQTDEGVNLTKTRSLSLQVLTESSAQWIPVWQLSFRSVRQLTYTSADTSATMMFLIHRLMMQFSRVIIS